MLLVDWRFHLAFTWWSLTVGLFLYRSHEPLIFGRYSGAWFALACAGLAGAAATTAMALRSAVGKEQAGPRRRAQPEGRRVPLLSLAAVSWGASLLTQYPVDERHIGWMLYGQLLGATQPAGVLLEYLALVLVASAIMRWCASLIRGVRPRSRRMTVVSLSISMIGGALLAEGAVRTANVFSPRTHDVPTKAARIWDWRYVRRNSLGYRDREFGTRPHESVYRILLIGDSFTFGAGIRNPGDRFGDRLERTLNRRGRPERVRVFNAGLGGTHSADHLAMARDLVPRVRPNLVLLVYVFNDIEHLELPPVPGALRPASFADRFSLHRILMLNSHLADEALLVWTAWTWSQPHYDDYLAELYRDPELLRRHLDVLNQIEETAESRAAAFRVVPFELHSDDRHGQYYSRFVHQCEARGLSVWSMWKVFRSHPYQALIMSRRDHHPNELANQLVADYLNGRVAEAMATSARPEIPGELPTTPGDGAAPLRAALNRRGTRRSGN